MTIDARSQYLSVMRKRYVHADTADRSLLLVAVTADPQYTLQAQALQTPSPPLLLGSSRWKWDRMPSIAMNTAGEALICANNIRVWTDDSPARISRDLPPDSVCMVLALDAWGAPCDAA